MFLLCCLLCFLGMRWETQAAEEAKETEQTREAEEAEEGGEAEDEAYGEEWQDWEDDWEGEGAESEADGEEWQEYEGEFAAAEVNGNYGCRVQTGLEVHNASAEEESHSGASTATIFGSGAGGETPGGARIVVRNHSYKQLAGKVLGDADALMAPIHSRSAAGNLHVRAGLQK
ncbi:unnamed protein product [Durusdinium trenchii]|uniref:Uncharacterized protein n=1 Tax=Durusdinium trenchii TaxID=1381693 RepID=A0ABP0HYS2_9DINO